ncbi:MAG: hypothetical protein P8Z00_05090 [Anaerolineales bacterium]
MSHQISLKEAERKVFRATYNDGLWDIFLGCFFLMFAIAPYLSSSLGDFLSTLVFLPFWGLVYLVIWLLRKYVVTPRVGSVKYGRARKTKLVKFSVVMLIVNVIAFILGLIAAMNFGRIPGQMFTVIFGLILLIGFSIAAYFLDFNVTFGITTGIMILVGLVVFVRLLRDNPVPIEGIPSDEA